MTVHERTGHGSEGVSAGLVELPTTYALAELTQKAVLRFHMPAHRYRHVLTHLLVLSQSVLSFRDVSCTR